MTATLSILRWAAGLLALVPFPAMCAPGATEAERLFTLKVKPLLSEKCFGCHGLDPKTGKEEFKGGLDLRSREAMLKGGESRQDVLISGNAAKSFLITAVKWEDEDYEMPPKSNDRLDAEQIALISRWVDSGAPWPNPERQAAILLAERQHRVSAEGEIIDTAGGLSKEWTFRRYKPEDVWAFKPVQKPELPAGDQGNPIDILIGERLKQAGFQPSGDADALTLIRRASFDLTGLPPTPFEVQRFRSAYGKDPEKAWGDLIDRLLASPHYGERWAQHWLDVARYADTGGYSNDYERSNAWRYRDYVIRAFNEDKPYDEFVVEQLAGDELADDSLRSRVSDRRAFLDARERGAYLPGESEKLIASSFLRMGPWDPAMVKQPEARQLYLDDVINAVGQTFLSTTMRCFKCHDHKFDPLPTRDYYRIYAAFAGTQLAERPAPFLPGEEQSGFTAGRRLVEQLHAFAREKRDALTEKR
ncbi:MAG: DUF1549 domain-containing protein, partial [Akkermansiaceae bacterium]|nr:DUF1549 domain-containing protein [Akkermansiaceae bacterium]